MQKPRLILASSYAALITIAFVVLITIWAELAAPLKDWLRTLSGHHWVSKSIFSILLYAVGTGVLYAIFHEPNDKNLRKAFMLLFAAVLLGVIMLTAFYTGHHLQFF